eukprot:967449-Pyramimonas_sp.AAC.1
MHLPKTLRTLPKFCPSSLGAASPSFLAQVGSRTIRVRACQRPHLSPELALQDLVRRWRLGLLADHLALKLAADAIRHRSGGCVHLASDEAETAAVALEQHINNERREPTAAMGLRPYVQGGERIHLHKVRGPNAASSNAPPRLTTADRTIL